MFKLKQNVAQIITRETGDVVRLDTVLMVSPGGWANPPNVRLTNSPSRLYNAHTGEELDSADTFISTRIVPVEL